MNNITTEPNPPVRYSDWRTLAVWALITLLSLVTFFTNRQFQSIESRIEKMEQNLTYIVQTSEKRISALEFAKDYAERFPKPCK